MSRIGILLSSFLFSAAFCMGADKPAPVPPRLSPTQIAQLNDAAKDIHIADLQRQVAELKRQLILAQACSEAGIPLKACSVLEDGSLTKKDEPEKK